MSPEWHCSWRDAGRGPGQTVNRLCGSGLQAAASAAQEIKVGSKAKTFIAPASKSMTCAPHVRPLTWVSRGGRKARRERRTTGRLALVNSRMRRTGTISLWRNGGGGGGALRSAAPSSRSRGGEQRRAEKASRSAWSRTSWVPRFPLLTAPTSKGRVSTRRHELDARPRSSSRVQGRMRNRHGRRAQWHQ